MTRVAESPAESLAPMPGIGGHHLARSLAAHWPESIPAEPEGPGLVRAGLMPPDPVTASGLGAGPADLPGGVAAMDPVGRASSNAPTPPPGHAPPPPVPVADLAAVVDQLRQTGGGTTEIALAPEELGRLRMQLMPDGDTVRVVLSAERPETLDLLRRNIDQLAADLRQMGFASASFGFAGWPGGQGSGGDDSHQPDEGEAAAPPGLRGAERALAGTSASGSASGLDLRL